jgi:hypothetical protein
VEPLGLRIEVVGEYPDRDDGFVKQIRFTALDLLGVDPGPGVVHAGRGGSVGTNLHFQKVNAGHYRKSLPDKPIRLLESNKL